METTTLILVSIVVMAITGWLSSKQTVAVIGQKNEVSMVKTTFAISTFAFSISVLSLSWDVAKSIGPAVVEAAKLLP